MVEKKGTAIMVVYTDVAVEHDADFNAWYNQEYLPERLSNPRFSPAGRAQIPGRLRTRIGGSPAVG